MSVSYDDVDPFKWSGSTIGNAYFSGVSMDQLWLAVSIAKTQHELDAAIDITIKLNNKVRSVTK